MQIQFDNNAKLDVVRSPFHSADRLVMYFVPDQLPIEQIVDQAKAAEHVYFYVNDAVLATFWGYTVFNQVSMNDTEITLTMINPNPEKKDDTYSDYVEAVKILLGDEVGDPVNMEVQ